MGADMLKVLKDLWCMMAHRDCYSLTNFEFSNLAGRFSYKCYRCGREFEVEG
jgi:hypothetical protein